MLEEASCSDCKLEIIERKWTKLLLKWLNTCIKPNDLKNLNLNILTDIINKYKEDICQDDLDRTLLNSEDVESFIKYKFPILRLRNLFEAKDYPKKLYIMTSMLLYYCCTNSRTGTVDADIRNNLDEEEQIMVLKFCEALTEMEATINNVDSAVKVAIYYQNEDQNKRNIETGLDSSKQYTSFISERQEIKRTPILQFKSSITVLPSVITEASISRSSFEECSDSSECRSSYGLMEKEMVTASDQDIELEAQGVQKYDSEESRPLGSNKQTASNPINHNQTFQKSSDNCCQPGCACSRCSKQGTCCGDPGCTKDICDVSYEDGKSQKSKRLKWIFCALISAIFVLALLILATIPVWLPEKTKRFKIEQYREEERYCYIIFPLQGENLRLFLQALGQLRIMKIKGPTFPDWAWQCRKNFCHKVFRPSTNKSLYTSLSRCTLLCMGPQLWPYPIGYTYFSKTIMAIATNKLEYKFQSIPSDSVHQYVAEAFKLFLKDLARLEKIDTKSSNRTQDLTVRKMIIQIDIESDPDPRLRVNTDEGYMLKVETNQNQVLIKVSGVSFCGVRHGFETLSQLILLDQSTGYLITLSSVIIKDAPSYKYRGLMIDTGRNYIPVVDLIKTVDAMATCKLNTFHWRISDVTSFPLNLIKLPQFFETGPYDRLMVYTKEDVKSIVDRAGIRGIRVLIEVAAPGPVGRPWSWLSSTTCPKKTPNFTCDNFLCMRLSMQETAFDILQIIYSEIIEMTNVDDIFHLSDSVFSMTNCYYLFDDREGFLDKALVRLKMANKGFLPKLPIIWYTSHLMRDFDAKTWDRLGVQIDEWDPNPTQSYLSKFRVIHSTKWDLSCEMKKQRCTKYKTWQQMYAWKSWRNVDVFTIEGGESILWTDLVDSRFTTSIKEKYDSRLTQSLPITCNEIDNMFLLTSHSENLLKGHDKKLGVEIDEIEFRISGNLEYHLWPRAAAVAERLWSDVVVNASVNRYVYMRLDTHRWRMLLRGVRVQPIWPAWCSFNPSSCLEKMH